MTNYLHLALYLPPVQGMSLSSLVLVRRECLLINIFAQNPECFCAVQSVVAGMVINPILRKISSNYVSWNYVFKDIHSSPRSGSWGNSQEVVKLQNSADLPVLVSDSVQAHFLLSLGSSMQSEHYQSSRDSLSCALFLLFPPGLMWRKEENEMPFFFLNVAPGPLSISLLSLKAADCRPWLWVSWGKQAGRLFCLQNFSKHVKFSQKYSLLRRNHRLTDWVSGQKVEG